MEDNVLTSSIEYNLETEETLPEYCLRKAQEHFENGKTNWVMDALTEEAHSFENFEEDTMKVASFLFKRGMRKGDTAIYMTIDMVHNHVFFTGVWRANGILRASYPEDDEETLLSRVEESRAGWIYCDPQAADTCKEAASMVSWDVDVIVKGEAEGCIPISELFEDEGDGFSNGLLECPELQITKDDPAIILCTSGTTGRSKGAVHTHRSILHSVDGAKEFLPLFDDEPNLIVSKGTHVTGVLFPFVALATGRLALLMPIVTKDNLFATVDKYKPAFIWGFPTFILQLVNGTGAEDYDFSSVKMVGSGGAQITPAMEKAIKQLPNVEALANFYGLTESVSLTGEINPEEGRFTKFESLPSFSIGKVVPGVALTIRDVESGSILGPRERGEICVKTDRNFSHYLNSLEATQNAFIDGYFKTGDLGYFDEEGFVFIVDRLKEIFKYYNNHISPTELEEVINQHEAVKEVCVIGIDDPDGGGCIPRAVVTVRNEDATPEEILEFANERLPDYKRIRGGLFIVEELPRGKTGKVTRNMVADLELTE